MRQHTFGALSPVSTLTLGGGGLGMLWGPTTLEECVATVHAAVDAGITLLDMAPATATARPKVVGEAFAAVPAASGSPANATSAIRPGEIEATLRHSIEDSLRLRLTRLDMFFLHSNVVPDEAFAAEWGDAGAA